MKIGRTVVSMQAMVASSFKSPALKLYKKSYQKRGEQRDPHENMFSSLSTSVFGDNNNIPTATARVLYPGCHRHITPSIYFPHVDYVDMDSKVSDVFRDPVVKEWIHSEQIPQQPPPNEWTFTSANFSTPLPKNFQPQSYDLLISLSAGVISLPCAKYVSENGYFLVNDSHGDASTAFAHRDALGWSLVAIWDKEKSQWDRDNLEQFFKTKRGEFISVEQAKEAVEIGSKSGRSYRLAVEADFYLFQRRANAEDQKIRKSTKSTKNMERESSKRQRR